VEIDKAAESQRLLGPEKNPAFTTEDREFTETDGHGCEEDAAGVLLASVVKSDC
jgi:hypothetical protein